MFDPVIEPENLLLSLKKNLLGITLKLTKVIGACEVYFMILIDF